MEGYPYICVLGILFLVIMATLTHNSNPLIFSTAVSGLGFILVGLLSAAAVAWFSRRYD